MTAGAPAVSLDAFLSFPPDQELWVRRLQADLESFAVTAFGEDMDVPPGMALPVASMANLSRAGSLVVVVTPEALVRPQLSSLWSSFMGAPARQGAGAVIPLLLIDAPLPPFLGDRKPIDLRDHDAEKYREGLAQ